MSSVTQPATPLGPPALLPGKTRVMSQTSVQGDASDIAAPESKDKEEFVDPRLLIFAKLANEAQLQRRRQHEGKSDAEEFRKRLQVGRKEYTDKEIKVSDVKYHWGRPYPIKFDGKKNLITVCQIMRVPADINHIQFIKYFVSDQSVEIFTLLFWYMHVKMFDGGSERTLGKLSDQISDKQVLLFWSFGVEKSDFRDRFYKYYLYALEPAIVGALRAHFPASVADFPSDLSSQVLKTLMLMFVGVPDPVTVQVEIKHALFAPVLKVKGDNKNISSTTAGIVGKEPSGLVLGDVRGSMDQGKGRKGGFKTLEALGGTSALSGRRSVETAKSILFGKSTARGLTPRLIPRAGSPSHAPMKDMPGNGGASADVVTVDIDVSTLMSPGTRNTLSPLKSTKKAGKNRKRIHMDVFDVRSMSPIVQRHMVVPLRFKKEYFRRSLVNAQEKFRPLSTDEAGLRKQKQIQEQWRRGQEKGLNVLRKASDKFDKELDTIEKLRDKARMQKHGDLLRRCMSQFVVEKWDFLMRNPIYLRTDLYDAVDIHTDSTAVLNNLIGGREGNHGYTLARSGLLEMLTA